MSEKLAYKASVILSILGLAFLLTDFTLTIANHSKQGELAQRQQTLAAGQPIAQLDQGMVNLMATLAVKNNDSQLQGLLASEGISVKNPEADKAAAPVEKPAEK